MSKKRKMSLIIAAAVVVVVIVILNMTADTSSAVKVTAATVEPGELVEIVSASGRIQPRTKVDITSEVTGEIINLLVREGQRVETGQPLVVLDTVQLRSDVDQARFAVEETKARSEGAKSTLNQAEEEFNRLQRLWDQNMTSETLYKASMYAHENAKSAADAAGAMAAQARSRYEKQLDYLEKAKIVAPMPGIVTFLDCEVGEIAPAQTAFTQGKTLMTIADLSVFEVEVEVDETEINKVDLGQSVEIEVDAFPDTTFGGEVIEIGNTAITQGLGTQDQSTNFRVKVVFQDRDVKIRPGMSATVDITTAKREGVLSVPFASVVIRSFDLDSLEAARAAEDQGEETSTEAVQAAETTEEDVDVPDTAKKEVKREELKGVFLIKDGKARFVRVETGVADQKNVEVLSGLSEGDSVVSGPYRMLRQINDGDALEVEIQSGEGQV